MVDHRGIEPLTSRLRTWRSPEWVAYADEQAEEMFFRLVKQLAEKEGVTEQLKAENQMLWGAGLRWRPLPQAEAPTEPTGETARVSGGDLSAKG